MRTNDLHQVIVTEDDFVDLLYHNESVPEKIIVNNDEWVKKFNKSCSEYDMTNVIEWELEGDYTDQEFIEKNLADWNLPEEYANLDILEFVLSKCSTTEQIERIKYEYAEFNKRNMINVLRWLKYFVDTLREHNLIWGVGRGSSVSSYLLYIIGIHKIDALQYDLDIKEFLK